MGMGLGLAQLGEFSFLVLAEGVSQDVISSADYNRMLFVALGTLILTPQLLKLGLRWTGETILIVNTVANTAASCHGRRPGTTIVWRSGAYLVFAGIHAVRALFLRNLSQGCGRRLQPSSLARAIAIPWAAGIAMLFPVIWLIEKLSRVLKPGHTLSAPEDEVHQLAMISAEEGSIMPYEAVLVRNVLHLDKVTTRDIMTPRPVVMKLASDMTLADVFEKTKEFTYSRIPVYDCEDPEMWKGVVFSRDILSALAKDQFETKVEALCSPIYFVSEKTPGHVLLKSFLKRRTHLFGVSDEYGDITGIVTLEDVIESMLGEEIVDEVDSAVDMQEVAQRRKRDRIRNASDVSNEGNQNDTAS